MWRGDAAVIRDATLTRLRRYRTPLLVLTAYVAACWAVWPYFAGATPPAGLREFVGMLVFLFDHPLRGLAALPFFLWGSKLMLFTRY